MANYFATLPAYKTGPGIDFSPVGNALDGITAQNNANRQFSLQQRQSDRADQEQQYQHGRNDKQDQLQQVQMFGKQAAAVDQMQGSQRAAAWQSVIARHGADGLTPEELDPVTGPKLLMAQAGQFTDPRDSKLKDLQVQKLQSDITNSAPKQEFTTIGRDSYGQPTYGFVDPRKLTVTPAAGSQPTTGELQPPPGQGLSGDAYLATLPKPQADQVRALAEGRMPIPGGFALKSPYWQQMMSHISQYDPNFDTVNYQARSKTRNDFTSGKSAQNITSFNTAIGHLDHLNHAIDDLKNSDYTAVNRATNATAGINADRAKKLAAFSTARNAVVEELTKAFKGGVGALAEVQEWEKLVDPNASSGALKQMVKTATDLLASRIDSVGDQYNRGMGTTSDPLKLLSPKAQEIWKKLNPDAETDGGAAGAARSAPRATVPTIGEIRDGFRFKGGNPGDPNSWEKAQ